MIETDNKYFECPKCGFMLTFHYNAKKKVYVSFCPFCKSRLEMDKEEYERDNEIYFEKD